MGDEGVDDMEYEGGVEKDGGEEVGRSESRHFDVFGWMILLRISTILGKLGQETYKLFQTLLPFLIGVKRSKLAHSSSHWVLEIRR